MKCEAIPVPPGQLFESPVWDILSNEIVWVDILNGTIFQYHPKSNRYGRIEVGQMVGAIARKKSGGYVAALQNGFAEISSRNNKVKMITDTEYYLPDNRFNDGKCDPAGRFWAGTMSVTGKRNAGNLYTLESDLSVSLKIEGVGCSNGMAWTNDNGTFFYIDTPTQQVAAYDYDIATGNISNKRVVINIPVENGLPDGMTIDTDGMLWIALWGGGKVERWNPDTGKMLDCFFLPCSNISSCTFGGEELGDLYITSARTGLLEEEMINQPLAGSLFVIKDCGYKGLPANAFNDA